MDQILEVVTHSVYPFAWVKLLLFILLIGLIYFWCIDLYAKAGVRKATAMLNTLTALTETLTADNARLNKELQRYKAKYKSSQSRLRSTRKRHAKEKNCK